MSVRIGRKKHRKKKIITHLLLVASMVLAVYFLNVYASSGKPLFISPIGKENPGVTSVRKILKEKNIPFSEISLINCCYVINIQNNGQVKFSREKNIEDQAASLQRILRELTIEGKPFKSIDFRFTKPTVSF